MESLSYNDTDLNSRQGPTQAFYKMRNKKLRRTPGGGLCQLGKPISETFFGSLLTNKAYC
jgi:hypothetical protein